MTTLAVIATDLGLNGERRLLNGDRAAAAWGAALAGGACRVACPPHDLEATAYARALGPLLVPWDEFASVTFDVAIVGPGAINLAGDELAGRLAERAGAELLFDVLSAERNREGWTVICDAGRGARDIISVRGPVVFAVSTDVARQSYVSVHRRTMARREMLSTGPTAQFSPLEASPWQPMTPRTPRPSGRALADARARADQAFNMQQAVAAPAQFVINEPPAIAAQLLLRFLVDRGFVARSADRLPPIDAAAIVEPSVSPASAPLSGTALVGVARPTAAIRRSPRTRDDTDLRLSRRPRVASIGTVCFPEWPNAVGLQRGPRRVSPSSQPGLRGPFRIAT